MESMRKQFTFYSSFYDAIQELPKKQQGEIVLAVCAYALYGEVTELKGAAKCAFELIQPILDTASSRSQAGRRGQEKTRQKRKEQPDSPEQTLNKPSTKRQQTPKEKEKEKEKENEIENDCYARAGEVVDLYRKICPGLIPCELVSAETNRAISERLREHNDLDIFRRLFRKAGSSDFLLGKVTGWRASLDWLMEERNFARVLNGYYDNRADPRAVPKGASGLGAAELEAIQRVLREEP